MEAIEAALNRLTFLEKCVYGALAIPVGIFVGMVLLTSIFWSMVWAFEFASHWPWPK